MDIKKFLAFLLVWGASLHCFASTAEEIAAQIEARLRTLSSLQAEFTQIYFSMSVSSPLEEKGRFYFQKPDLMKWEYREPEKKFFLYKNGNFWFYLPEDNQLIRSRISGEQYESEILALFSGQRKLQETYGIEFNPFPSENGSGWQIKLTPREEGEYSYILLDADPKTRLIHRAIFFDWAGNKTEFRFGHLKADARLAPDTFDLTVPADCEIIENQSPPASKPSREKPV